MDLNLLAKLMGHPNPSDTLLYIHSSWDKTLADFDRT